MDFEKLDAACDELNTQVAGYLQDAVAKVLSTDLNEATRGRSGRRNANPSTSGLIPSHNVLYGPGVEPWRQNRDGAGNTTGHTVEFLVQVTIPERAKTNNPRKAAMMVQRCLVDWMTVRNRQVGDEKLGKLNIFKEIPFDAEIVDFEEGHGVVLNMSFHLCETYPNTGGAG